MEACARRRDWIIAPASAVLLVALLLQIARFDTQNAQAYTTVIGAYLVVLAIVGLSRMKLIPELEEASGYIEALGAATIMLPSFAQSIGGGWRYEVILVVETIVFFAAGVGLRRRGLVSAAAVALVLVDAVNALPNWITIMLAGLALLAVGVGILVSRERWGRWQTHVQAWWGEQWPA
ncbi:MAG: hypothetical protein EPO22_08245 [Dehalococcoidia bacterium]|nr:MAG: hypothetical protein EPO22_08245 [Dehalococcoidia bacterium]